MFYLLRIRKFYFKICLFFKVFSHIISVFSTYLFHVYFLVLMSFILFNFYLLYYFFRIFIPKDIILINLGRDHQNLWITHLTLHCVKPLINTFLNFLISKDLKININLDLLCLEILDIHRTRVYHNTRIIHRKSIKRSKLPFFNNINKGNRVIFFVHHILVLVGYSSWF